MEEYFNRIDAKPTRFWFNEQVSTGVTTEQMQSNFLTQDLGATSEASFENDIQNMKNYILPSNILIQINEIVDISLPYHKRQLLEANKTESKRTLKFLLSDGHHQYLGISKTDLPFFHPRIIPGLKVKLFKGTKAKYGVFLLEAEKIQVIGGLSMDLQNKRNSIIIHNDFQFNHQNDQISQNSINDRKKTRKRNTKNSNQSRLIVSTDTTNQLINESGNQQQNCFSKDPIDSSNMIFLDDSISSNSSDIELIDSLKPKETKQTSFLSDEDDDFNDFELISSIQQSSIQGPNSNSKVISFPEQNFHQNQEKNQHEPNEINHTNPNQNEFCNFNQIQNEMQIEDTANENQGELTNEFSQTNFNHIEPENKFDSDFIQKMKIWQIQDLFQNKKKVEVNFTPEIILLDAEILRCYELKIIQNKHGAFFSMSCMVAKSSISMEMKVASIVLNELLKTTPDEWLTLSYDDQMQKYEMCTKELLEMFDPLIILINPKISKKEKFNEYFILTKEFMQKLEFQ